MIPTVGEKLLLVGLVFLLGATAFLTQNPVFFLGILLVPIVVPVYMHFRKD